MPNPFTTPPRRRPADLLISTADSDVELPDFGTPISSPRSQRSQRSQNAPLLQSFSESPAPGQHPCEAGSSSARPRSPPPHLARLLEDEPIGRPFSRSARLAERGGALAGDPAQEHTSLFPDRHGPSARWYHGPVFQAGVKLAILFAVFSTLCILTFWFGMPKVDPEDKPALKLPRSFDDLQALNSLLHKYKTLFPWRIMLCGVVAYLYVQAFTLPGSMYISMLLGAAFGIVPGLFLSCFCEATGSVLCYTLSAILAPPLLELPFYRTRLQAWRVKIMGDPAKGQQASWDSVFTVLVVLRILPLPPHWIANFVAPHLGINVAFFWLTAFVGMVPMSVIHVMIGASLDQMTSADDFHLISVRNVLGLAAVIVAVLIPMALKRVFKKDFGDLAEAAPGDADALDDIPAPQAVQFDEHGLPKRHEADGGVRLAGADDGGEQLVPLDVPKYKPRGRPGDALGAFADEPLQGSFYELSMARPQRVFGGGGEGGKGGKGKGNRSYGTLGAGPSRKH